MTILSSTAAFSTELSRQYTPFQLGIYVHHLPSGNVYLRNHHLGSLFNKT
jgi:hypothetical protein